MNAQSPAPIAGREGHLEAAVAIAGLLERLKLEYAFLGSVAHAAWLGEEVDSGSVDLVALVSPERCQQIPMMAANNGFAVDAEEVESARELDLIPMRYRAGESEIRVHVLMATTAIYTRMIRDAVDVALGDRSIRVVGPEDLLLLLVVDDRPEAARRSTRLVEALGEGFDGAEFNRRLSSIGLGAKAIRP